MSGSVMDWRPVPDYEGLYEVSNTGLVRSLPHVVRSGRGTRVSPGRILKTHMNRKGYINAVLSANNTTKNHTVHRLVLLAFKGLDVANTQANHINGVRDDNRLENLEWISAADNIKHAYQVLGRKGVWKDQKGDRHNHSQAIEGYDIHSGELVCSYTSMNEAQRAGYHAGCISAAVNGLRSHHKGLKWVLAP